MIVAAVRLGAGFWLILGPIVVALALVVWLLLTVRATRQKIRPKPEHEGDTGIPHRGPVQGGIFEGDPGQRNVTPDSPEPR